MFEPRMMNDLLSLCHVPRWVIVPRLREQTVAEHSFRVAIITMELGVRLDITTSKITVLWALIHDGGECRSGDVPNGFKDEALRDRDSEMTPWMKNYDPYIMAVDKALVKLADKIETATWIMANKPPSSNHAHYVATRMWDEVRDFCQAAAPVLGYGPDKLREIVEELMLAIHHEVGRATIDPAASPVLR